jgi:penicillin-binding protein 1A
LGDNQTGAAVSAPIWHDYMATALAGRPVLSFPIPPGVTMAPWSSGSGTVIDAFKADQIPGASAPIGMGLASVPSPDGTPSQPPVVHGGVDNSMGGLY